MLHPVPTLKETPSQTAGPYVHIGLTPNFADIKGIWSEDLGSARLFPDAQAPRIMVSGRVIDGAGAPVSDAVVECWQANAEGQYAAVPKGQQPASADGWGRQPVNADGVFTFDTIKPGAVTGPDGKPMAPHIGLWIVARGINIGLQTRLYFEDETDANAADFVLGKIADPRRRLTLVARREAADMVRYVLDIYLQGERETVFFDV